MSHENLEFFDHHMHSIEKALTHVQELVLSCQHKSKVWYNTHSDSINSKWTVPFRSKSIASESTIPYKDYKILNKIHHRQNIETQIKVLYRLNQDGTHSTISSQDEIAEEGFNFFSKLYEKKENGASNNQIKSFLGKSDPVKLPSEVRENLMSPFTLAEFNKILPILKKKKSAPGPGGLTYSFYVHYWNQLAPELVRVANDISIYGKLPLSMQSVAIKLLPKQHSTAIPTINDFRPISLTNVSLRIISMVLNQRLITTLPSIVNPQQTGFTPGLSMEDNIIQMKLLYNKIHGFKEKEDITGDFAKNFSAIFIDFFKAFDCLSHSFITETLGHLRFPTKLINLIKATTYQQKAYLFLNNHAGKSFPLASGVRQGLPHSPTLFIIGLEVLLHNLRAGIPGISIPSPLKTLQLQQLSFADDIVIFTHQRDHPKFLQILNDFCFHASMQINEKKSQNWILSRNHSYYGMTRDQFINSFPTVLPYPKFLLDPHEPLKYLGITIQGTNWAALTSEINRKIRFPLIQHQPISIRTESLSIYHFSRVYFRDQYDSIPQKHLSAINKEAKSQLKGVSLQTLLLPKKYGGFSLMNLQNQLLGKRAKMIYQVFQQSNHYYHWDDFRQRLQSFVNHLVSKTGLSQGHYNDSSSMFTPILPANRLISFNTRWISNYSNSSFITFPWWQLFDGTFTRWINLPENTNTRTSLGLSEEHGPYSTMDLLLHHLPKLRKNYTNLKLSKHFTLYEIDWIKAWFQVVPNTSIAPDTILSFKRFSSKTELYESWIANREPSLTALERNCRDISDELVNLESFKHFNKKFQETYGSPVHRTNIPVHILPPDINTENNWLRYWSTLTHFQTQKPGSLEFLQRFSLGHFDHKFNLAKDFNAELPHKHLPSCCLCGIEEESFSHIFYDCQIAKWVWAQISADRQPTLTQLTMSLNDDFSTYYQYSIYIELLWDLRIKQRYSKSSTRPPPYSYTNILSITKWYLSGKYNTTRYYRY